jgi:glucosamine kinase
MITVDLVERAAMLFLGVDGGGTKCRARIRDAAGRLLGEAASGPANIHQDFPGTVRSIMAAAEAAARAAGLSRDSLATLHAGLGLAGVETLTSLTPLQDALPFATLTALNDAPAACLGAHAGADGGIVLAGTGSAGCAIVGGVATVIGGWGFELGDGGSGAIMGRAALRAAVSSIDGLGPVTPATEQILARLGRSRPAIAAWVKTATTADYAQFAPLLFELSGNGDDLAQSIVAEAVGEVAGIARRLLALGAERLCLLGGLAEAMQSRLPDALALHFAAPITDAMDGAIMAARRAAGLPALPGGYDG